MSVVRRDERYERVATVGAFLSVGFPRAGEGLRGPQAANGARDFFKGT